MGTECAVFHRGVWTTTGLSQYATLNKAKKIEEMFLGPFYRKKFKHNQQHFYCIHEMYLGVTNCNINEYLL